MALHIYKKGKTQLVLLRYEILSNVTPDYQHKMPKLSYRVMANVLKLIPFLSFLDTFDLPRSESRSDTILRLLLLSYRMLSYPLLTPSDAKPAKMKYTIEF